MISQRIKEHISYYISLSVILFLGVILTMQFSSNKQLQMLTVVLTTIFYIILSIVHHKENHELSNKIVIEYVLIGSLGMIVVFFLLKGGF